MACQHNYYVTSSTSLDITILNHDYKIVRIRFYNI
jgi:hypothetical protein